MDSDNRLDFEQAIDYALNKTKSCIIGCPNAIINAGTGFKNNISPVGCAPRTICGISVIEKGRDVPYMAELTGDDT